MSGVEITMVVIIILAVFILTICFCACLCCSEPNYKDDKDKYYKDKYNIFNDNEIEI
tara:strand:+ start:371 stop:541 length:171 start_codon:yes stop_codon:yes gene_type:complete